MIYEFILYILEVPVSFNWFSSSSEVKKEECSGALKGFIFEAKFKKDWVRGKLPSKSNAAPNQIIGRILTMPYLIYFKCQSPSFK